MQQEFDPRERSDYLSRTVFGSLGLLGLAIYYFLEGSAFGFIGIAILAVVIPVVVVSETRWRSRKRTALQRRRELRSNSVETPPRELRKKLRKDVILGVAQLNQKPYVLWVDCEALGPQPFAVRLAAMNRSDPNIVRWTSEEDLAGKLWDLRFRLVISERSHAWIFNNYFKYFEPGPEERIRTRFEALVSSCKDPSFHSAPQTRMARGMIGVVMIGLSTIEVSSLGVSDVHWMALFIAAGLWWIIGACRVGLSVQGDSLVYRSSVRTRRWSREQVTGIDSELVESSVIGFMRRTRVPVIRVKDNDGEERRVRLEIFSWSIRDAAQAYTTAAAWLELRDSSEIQSDTEASNR